MNETKAKYIHKFGAELGSCFFALWNDIVWLNVKSMEFGELFGDDESINLLNQTASQFFRILQGIMIEDIILHISRLTDPEKSCGKDNLSLLKMISLIKNDDKKQKLELYLRKAVEDSNICKNYRNKMIAHNDYELKVKNEEIKIIKKDITGAIKSVNEFLNQFSLMYDDGCELIFLNPLYAGAEALIRKLKDSKSDQNNSELE